MVPLVDLRSQQKEIAAEILPRLQEVLSNAEFIGGEDVGAFEKEYAKYLSVRHCIGVGNGTDALELALIACDVPKGSEVVVPANTFIASVEAIVRAGAVPVLADVDETHLLMNAESAAAVITSRTSAIVPVHLFGQTAPMEPIVELARRSGAFVIEDAAQAQGARQHDLAAGSFGDIAATSFYPGKNLGAAGDAGAVMTDDDDLARRVRLLGAHGSEKKYLHEIMGRNSRLDTIQAVVLRAKLRRLDTWNIWRRQAAERYRELLADIDGVFLPESAPGNVDVWHLFVIRVEDRDRVIEHLRRQGISTGIHYPTPIHRTAAWRNLGLAEGSFPNAEAASEQILSLPLYPHITEDEQWRVAVALRDAVTRRLVG
jgi:Predicted pyridoxal phosphate-dependent enzyme apparently involved in regulation of cell wall biogenesis